MHVEGRSIIVQLEEWLASPDSKIEDLDLFEEEGDLLKKWPEHSEAIRHIFSLFSSMLDERNIDDKQVLDWMVLLFTEEPTLWQDLLPIVRYLTEEIKWVKRDDELVLREIVNESKKPEHLVAEADLNSKTALLQEMGRLPVDFQVTLELKAKIISRIKILRFLWQDRLAAEVDRYGDAVEYAPNHRQFHARLLNTVEVFLTPYFIS